MRPRQVLALDSLPLLPGRKIDEDALLERAASTVEPPADRAPARHDHAPSRRALTLVDKAWRIALGRAPPRNKASFEEAGRDSL